MPSLTHRMAPGSSFSSDATARSCAAPSPQPSSPASPPCPRRSDAAHVSWLLRAVRRAAVEGAVAVVVRGRRRQPADPRLVPAPGHGARRLEEAAAVGRGRGGAEVEDEAAAPRLGVVLVARKVLAGDGRVAGADVLRDGVAQDAARVGHLEQLGGCPAAHEVGALPEAIRAVQCGHGVRRVEGGSEEPQAVDGAAQARALGPRQLAAVQVVGVPLLDRVDVGPAVGDGAGAVDLRDQGEGRGGSARAGRERRLARVVGDEAHGVLEGAVLALGGGHEDRQLLRRGVEVAQAAAGRRQGEHVLDGVQRVEDLKQEFGRIGPRWPGILAVFGAFSLCWSDWIEVGIELC